ncbi:MAG: FkbM family methyltransferase, partial [Planctomycetota bacterium]
GSVTLFEPDVRGWATTSEGQGLQLIDSHVTCVERTVPVRTLTEMCDEHAGGRDIHFLKIDVEGAESDVIAGMDFTRYRPWILVIESCEPRTEVDSFDSWEPQVVASGYRHVYRDGLNRYYVAGEREELFEAFDLPPNLFDGYIFSREVETRQQLEDTRRHLVHQEQSLEDTMGELRRLRLTCADGERALARERGQTSRLDADLARARARIARLKAGSIKVIARRSVVRARVVAVSAAAASARTASRVDGRLRADISRGARQAHRLARATKVNAKRTAVRLDRMARRTKAGFDGMARRAAARTRNVAEQTAATTRRVTTPLGVVGRKGIKKSTRSARAAAKFSVLVTNAALNQVPGCKRLAVRALRAAPPVERRLREVVRRRFLQEQYKQIANTQVSHSEPSRPLKRARPASLGRKRIEAKLSVGTVYYYVGHTVKFSANTGVQRVVRKV